MQFEKRQYVQTQFGWLAGFKRPLVLNIGSALTGMGVFPTNTAAQVSHAWGESVAYLSPQTPHTLGHVAAATACQSAKQPQKVAL